MVKLRLIKSMVASSVLACTLSAQADMDTSWLTVEARGSADAKWAEDSSGDLKESLSTSDVEVIMTAQITKNIKFVLKTELERALRTSGTDVSSTFDLDSFIEEAYVEIRNVAGQPVAFVVGKQEIPVGLQKTLMPFDEDGTKNIIREKGVFGLTMKLGYNFFGLIDSAEVSVFETGRDDLEIGDIEGMSVRVNKQLSEVVKASASYKYRGSAGAGGEDEHTVSVGAVYDDGTWIAYVEGIGMVNHADYPDADFAVTLGAGRNIGPGQAVVEYNYIDSAFHSIGLGYNLKLTDHLTIGPEVRYNMYEDGREDGAQFGVRATVDFTDDRKENENTLLGNKASGDPIKKK